MSNYGPGAPQQQFELKSSYSNPTSITQNPTMLFVIGSILGALSCFSRADYNLPLFAFLAVMWN